MALETKTMDCCGFVPVPNSSKISLFDVFPPNDVTNRSFRQFFFKRIALLLLLLLLQLLVFVKTASAFCITKNVFNWSPTGFHSIPSCVHCCWQRTTTLVENRCCCLQTHHA